jgi:hypothetical protein
VISGLSAEAAGEWLTRHGFTVRGERMVARLADRPSLAWVVPNPAREQVSLAWIIANWTSDPTLLLFADWPMFEDEQMDCLLAIRQRDGVHGSLMERPGLLFSGITATDRVALYCLDSVDREGVPAGAGLGRPATA